MSSSDPPTWHTSTNLTPMATTTGSSNSRRARKPTEFLLPNGRKILVALPEEAARLRDKYTHHADDSSAVQVKVVIHGSEEHHQHLRHLHSHHTAQRDAMRTKHGQDFGLWERTRNDLDEVGQQLESLSGRGAAETLSANFERFGYTSVLRPYDDDGKGGGASGMATPKRHGDAQEAWRRPRGRAMRRAVFLRGTGMMRGVDGASSCMRQGMDRANAQVIVMLDMNGESASEHPDGHRLLRFVIMFVMSWKIWSDVQQTISWFETDDILQRVQVLFLIACLLGTNTTPTFSEEYDTYVQLVSFYLAARLFQACYFGLTACLLPLIKGIMISHIIAIIIPSALWIASTHVEMPSRLGLVFVALANELLGPFVVMLLLRYSRTHDKPLATQIERLYEFFPAVNIEHKVERTDAFVSLVIGYGAVSLLYQNAGYGINAFLRKAVMGMIQGFIFNWIYFEIDGENIHVHAIRNSVSTACI
ncbi:hypothetical protein SCUP234_03424 [Seiridium cupressi]